jgi:FAD/FMN-containing dehydrogenase
MYGRRGLTQHQCVLPNEAGAGAARRFLEVLTARGGASFLCVIKDCGPQGVGMLSFPRPGISIALDIAVRKETPALIDALNECVLKEGGRIYLAKDAFTRAEHFRAMEPRIDEFQRVRRIWDPTGKLRSAQSVRLLGDRVEEHGLRARASFAGGAGPFEGPALNNQ